jgi:hypothetical protein
MLASEARPSNGTQRIRKRKAFIEAAHRLQNGQTCPPQQISNFHAMRTGEFAG